MTDPTPTDLPPRPVLPIDYAGPDEQARVLRPVGRIAMAVAGVMLVNGLLQYLLLFSSEILRGSLRSLVGWLMPLGLPIVRLPVLAWMVLAAWRLSTGRLTAAVPLRQACLTFAVLMGGMAVLSLFAQSVTLGPLPAYLWPQVLYNFLRTALEGAVPLMIWGLLRTPDEGEPGDGIRVRRGTPS